MRGQSVVDPDRSRAEAPVFASQDALGGQPRRDVNGDGNTRGLASRFGCPGIAWPQR
jgi:hypothetical protein